MSRDTCDSERGFFTPEPYTSARPYLKACRQFGGPDEGAARLAGAPSVYQTRSGCLPFGSGKAAMQTVTGARAKAIAIVEVCVPTSQLSASCKATCAASMSICARWSWLAKPCVSTSKPCAPNAVQLPLPPLNIPRGRCRKRNLKHAKVLAGFSQILVFERRTSPRARYAKTMPYPSRNSFLKSVLDWVRCPPVSRKRVALC